MRILEKIHSETSKATRLSAVLDEIPEGQLSRRACKVAEAGMPGRLERS
jgi:hypothetical protein